MKKIVNTTGKNTYLVEIYEISPCSHKFNIIRCKMKKQFWCEKSL